MADVADAGLEFRAIHMRALVAVHAVEAHGVKIRVEGFVGVVAPTGLGFNVAGRVGLDAVVFEVGVDVFVAPIAHRVEAHGAARDIAYVEGERDMAFDKVGVFVFRADIHGFPRPVEVACWALEEIGHTAEIAFARIRALGAEAHHHRSFSPLVILEHVEPHLSGLDIRAIGDGHAGRRVVVDRESPFLDKPVAVGITLAKLRLAVLHNREI